MGNSILKLLVDFQNADTEDRVRINTKGALDYISNNKIVLKVYLHDEELSAIGTLEFSKTKNVWVGVIKWDELREIMN